MPLDGQAESLGAAGGAAAGALPAALTPALVPLLTEIGDLKRVIAAHMDASFATRSFLRGWGRIARGDNAEALAYEHGASAVAAARLGAIDGERLVALSLSEDEARATLLRSLDKVAGPVDGALAARLRDAMPLREPPMEDLAPPFAKALARQPRAGVTCPGRARVMLQPEENHADHSWVVAAYALILAPAFGADPARAWWFGMTHHLHSAGMPDAGFTGEMLLEPNLGRVIDAAREQALRELPDAARARVEPVFAEIAADETPEARAFHAADVIDRVLETQYHTRANGLTMDRVLNEYELVHDGPVKGFHDDVLRAVALP